MIVILVIAYSAFFRIHDVWNIQMEAAVPVPVHSFGGDKVVW